MTPESKIRHILRGLAFGDNQMDLEYDIYLPPETDRGLVVGFRVARKATTGRWTARPPPPPPHPRRVRKRR